jgi:hypothetical protein
MCGTPTGRGYWLVSSQGRVFNFGDATATGSIPSPPGSPVVSIASTPSGSGYWLLTANDAVYAFGDAGYYGAG